MPPNLRSYGGNIQVDSYGQSRYVCDGYCHLHSTATTNYEPLCNPQVCEDLFGGPCVYVSPPNPSPPRVGAGSTDSGSSGSHEPAVRSGGTRWPSPVC
jgi:hypothetical protein